MKNKIIQCTRIEKDSLGEKADTCDKLYGIHSIRARENFPGQYTVFPLNGIKQLELPNWPATILTENSAMLQQKTRAKISRLKLLDDDILDALCDAAKEVADGDHFEHFIVPAVQGGAGTSINMNINEIITNAALLEVRA